MDSEKSIAVLYHAGCPDGFGAAYAAWKKFGDSAVYLPVKHQTPPPAHLEGKELYLLDFCYEQDYMNALLKNAKSLIIIDHHEGVEAITKSMPQHVYDTEHSGATLSWQYFHPDAPTPLFLKYVEDVDLFRQIPDDERALITYAYAQPFRFDIWDEHVRKTADEGERAKMVGRGSTYQEYFQLLCDRLMLDAELVVFESYTVYLLSGQAMFITELGHRLFKKQPPFALVARAQPNGIRVSMRGDGSVNVAEIASRYGGNGHPNSAAFTIPYDKPIPWKPVNPSE